MYMNMARKLTGLLNVLKQEVVKLPLQQGALLWLPAKTFKGVAVLSVWFPDDEQTDTEGRLRIHPLTISGQEPTCAVCGCLNHTQLVWQTQRRGTWNREGPGAFRGKETKRLVPFEISVAHTRVRWLYFGVREDTPAHHFNAAWQHFVDISPWSNKQDPSLTRLHLWQTAAAMLWSRNCPWSGWNIARNSHEGGWSTAFLGHLGKWFPFVHETSDGRRVLCGCADASGWRS